MRHHVCRVPLCQYTAEFGVSTCAVDRAGIFGGSICLYYRTGRDTVHPSFFSSVRADNLQRLNMHCQPSTQCLSRTLLESPCYADDVGCLMLANVITYEWACSYRQPSGRSTQCACTCVRAIWVCHIRNGAARLACAHLQEKCAPAGERSLKMLDCLNCATHSIPLKNYIVFSC